MEEANSSAGIANNVALAIAAALDWNSTPDARKAAVSYLDSVKTGDVRVLANTSLLLVKRDWSSEIRLQAFKMLQHLVRLRWEELTPLERRNFANVAVELMSEMTNPSEEWPLKSQKAALVAEIVRREGIELWQELLPSLISLSNQGPVQAELVSMMLRWLPEDITVHNEDLEGDRRRLLLRGLTQSLPEILPLLYTLLERHFGAALNEASRQQLDLAKEHAATVTATLNAINAYVEWAPLPDLAKFGIIHGCGFLLSATDFRLHACEFFKLVSSRKRTLDASVSEFNSAISSIFQILMNVSRDFLYKSSSTAAAVDENEIEFAEYICESMVALGSTSLRCVSGNSSMVSIYLQQMLGFFQHYKLGLHYQSLLFWLVCWTFCNALMRDLVSKPKVTAAASGDGSAELDSEKQMILNLVDDNICSSILDISFQRILRKEKAFLGASFAPGTLELWSDDVEGKGDFGQYRSKLSELMRLMASFKPVIASSKISDRMFSIINSPLTSPVPVQDLAVMESLQTSLENIVSVVFDGSNELAGGSSELHLAVCRIFEGLLQRFLSLKWMEPALVEILVHYLDALGPFMKYFPDAVGGVINKLFELLTSLPFVVKNPSTSDARRARLQVCMSFIRIAKAADKSILPHMKGIADTMGHMQREGCLLRSEHNLLGEAFLVMASAAGCRQQQEVLNWLLEPLSQQWMQLDWQNKFLSEPLGIVQLCLDTPSMWSIYHTVTFFEKALKRSGFKKSNLNTQYSSTTNPPMHPLSSHLAWMLPPLLKLLRALHALWSPSISQMLPAELKAAMLITDAEKYNLLGEGNPKLSNSSQTDDSKEGHAEINEADIRNWLKGIRDSGYNVLGLATTIGDPLFKCLDADSVALALMENIQSLEYRHLRQLIHSVLVYFVKFCPPELWEAWLEKLLHPLFVHIHQVLSSSWSSLLHEGRAKAPDVQGIVSGSDLQVEVMEEKLLRDLTREMSTFLSVMASPGLNTGLPTLEQSGHINRVDTSSLKDLDAFLSNSMVAFILKHNSLALPALQICLEAFTWTDGESMTKVSSFCDVVVVLAISTRNLELQQFVCKDLFSSAIKGLALESNAIISADLISLCRDIFVHLCDRDPAPRQVLLSLPCISPHDLAAFEEALTKTSSSKEQKQHMRSLLMLATGNKLKALAAQKSVNTITNVTARYRSSAAAQETKIEDGEPVGLAAIM
ncbi:Protein HASTY 1 [Linum perenne]